MTAVYRLHDGGWASNCYLLACPDGGASGDIRACAVIDPSYSADRLLGVVKAKKLRVDAILLTHGHFDHMLELRELRERTGAPVMVGAGDAAYLADAGLSLFKNAAGTDTVFDAPERTLADGDTLYIGETAVNVMATPGHTPGSVCYMAGDGIIFSGDTLFLNGIGRTDLPGGSRRQLAQSLRRLSELSGDYKIYPGHGDATTLAAERACNIYMKI